jgi:hypothetical protein
MTTATKKDNAFDAACEEEGLVATRGDMHPFLPFKDKVGSWVVGTVEPGFAVEYKPKKGKNKGKLVKTTYFHILVEKADMPGVSAGDKFTISPTGLLLYQLTEGKPEAVELPAKVAIRYIGRDDEDRHQTEVKFPKA